MPACPYKMELFKDNPAPYVCLTGFTKTKVDWWTVGCCIQLVHIFNNQTLFNTYVVCHSLESIKTVMPISLG